jgi:hypothetical protein
MKKVLLPVLLFLAINLFSQDDPFISFGAELNPKIVTNIFKKSDHLDPYHPLSGSIAGNIYLNFSPRLSLLSGLSFNALKAGQRDYSILLGNDHDENGNALLKNSWINTEYLNYYLGIPVDIQWNLSDKANSPYLKLGQETLFKVEKKTTNEIVSNGGNEISPISSPQTHEFSDFIITFNFGIGYEFVLNENIKFYLEPNIEYSANPFLKNDTLAPTGFNELNRHFLNLGLNMGLRF